MAVYCAVAWCVRKRSLLLDRSDPLKHDKDTTKVTSLLRSTARSTLTAASRW